MMPFARPGKPLSESKIALVTTGGVHLKTQKPFDIDDPLGDCSYREIPADAPDGDLTWTHYYHAPEREKYGDLDAILPLRTLGNLVSEGLIGEVGSGHFSFMGAIQDADPLIDETAPEVAEKLVSGGVDAVLVTPSCPLCHRNAALIAQEVERGGIPTVMVSMEDGVKAPRVGRVGFGYNEPCGRPGDDAMHRDVVLGALALIHDMRSPGEIRLPFG